MLDKNKVFHLWELWRAASTTNIILFVSDPRTTLSASSVSQVVCESTIITKAVLMCTICNSLCRVHMPINCVHTHLDLIRNLTQFTHFYEKFAVF